jgi:hypothetical protein
LRHVSDVITDILADPEITDDAREAIEEGVFKPHRHCPCVRCMRAYLASVEAAKVEPASVPEPAENA